MYPSAPLVPCQFWLYVLVCVWCVYWCVCVVCVLVCVCGVCVCGVCVCGVCVVCAWCINPLTTEFFPPRQHIFMHSAHTTFVGTPLPQHSLLSGQTWWGPHTWRDPSGNTVNDIHDPPQGQQSEVKGGCQLDFRPAFP